MQGLIKAVKELLPHAEHRNCTRHIYSNIKSAKLATDAVQDCFYDACMATHPVAFQAAMKRLLKVSKPVHDRLSKLDPKVWTKAYFETQCKADSNENNMSECFNSWILRTRLANHLIRTMLQLCQLYSLLT